MQSIYSTYTVLCYILSIYSVYNPSELVLWYQFSRISTEVLLLWYQFYIINTKVLVEKYYNGAIYRGGTKRHLPPTARGGRRAGGGRKLRGQFFILDISSRHNQGIAGIIQPTFCSTFNICFTNLYLQISPIDNSTGSRTMYVNFNCKSM